MQLLLNRAFFGKNNCFKIIVNNNKECYFHFGVKGTENYSWEKFKMNDLEIADIIDVISRKRAQVSFFHNFKDKKSQMWVNTQKDYLFIKSKTLSKSFAASEQRVLSILLTRAIEEMNYGNRN